MPTPNRASCTGDRVVIASCRGSLTAMILFAVFLLASIIVTKSGMWEGSLRERARLMQSPGNRPDTDSQHWVGRLIVTLIVVGLISSAAALIECQN